MHDQIDIVHHLANSNEFFGMDLTRYGITKHVWMVWIAAVILIVLLSLAFRKRSATPSGVTNLLEALLLFIRDEVVVPNMGHEGMRYLPFLWTLFMFVLTLNLIGLVPGGATATGNISVTATLAVLSFLMTQFAGVRQNGVHYITGLVPKVPWWLYPLMLVCELIGLVAKPFALAIRLWANMNGGHIVLLVILGFIFIFKSWIAVGVSVPFTVLLMLLELFVAVLQAYVFTFLTSVFMGIALHPEH